MGDGLFLGRPLGSCAKLLSWVQLSVTVWAVAHQAPLWMGFSRQEHWWVSMPSSRGSFPIEGTNQRLLNLLHWQACLFCLVGYSSPLFCDTPQS